MQITIPESDNNASALYLPDPHATLSTSYWLCKICIICIFVGASAYYPDTGSQSCIHVNISFYFPAGHHVVATPMSKRVVTGY